MASGAISSHVAHSGDLQSRPPRRERGSRRRWSDGRRTRHPQSDVAIGPLGRPDRNIAGAARPTQEASNSRGACSSDSLRPRLGDEETVMLHEFITLNRVEIVRRCRAKVATSSVPPPTKAEIDHGVPLFLDQLVDALRLGQSERADIANSALLHGHDLLCRGFTVSQVVHDYGDVCQSITELAVQTNAPISTDDFRMLNQCLDQAIASAVTSYARESQQSCFDAADRGSERMGFLVHELRNLVNTAIVAFEVLKKGSVGIAGNTGTVLNRSLMGLRDLIARSTKSV